MKNITARNLVGGFLGGFLGILSGSFIHPMAIPLGCVVGVLTGFWFKEIRPAVFDGLQKTLSWFRLEIDLGFVLSKARSFGLGFGRWSRYRRLTWMRGVRQVTRFGYLCISCLGLIIALPFRLIRLCFSHPVIIARTIRALSIISTTVAVLATSYVICPDADEIGRYVSVLFLSVISTMLSFFGPEGLLEDGKLEGLSNFFYAWSRYSRQGPVMHAVKSVLQHLLAMAMMSLALLIVVLLFFGGVTSILAFVLVSVLANALWIASSRHEHLLCVVVTLTVTITSAILCSGYMHGIGLWSVALATGVLSGLATEIVRRTVVFVFNNTLLYKFLGDFADSDRPDEMKFGVTKWRVWNLVANFFDQSGQKLVLVMQM